MTYFGQGAFRNYEINKLAKQFPSGTWKGEAWNTKV